METKRCSRCGETFPISSFRFDNVAKNLRKSACRECENKRIREDRAKHGDKRRLTDRERYRGRPEWRAVTNWMRRFGLTEEQAREAAQHHSCDICGRDNGHRRLVVDHCHATDRNRGLLCNECNLGLGKFADDPERMRRAADYLEAGGSGRF